MILKDSLVEEIIETTMLKGMDPRSVELSIIIKPRDGRSGNGVHVIDTQENLEYYKHFCDNENYIYQHMYEGDIVTVDVCRDKKTDRIVCLAREELIRTSNGAGVSVRVFKDDSLKKSAKKSQLYLMLKVLYVLSIYIRQRDTGSLSVIPDFRVE